MRLRIAADIEQLRADMSKRKAAPRNRGAKWVRQFNQAALELKEIGRHVVTSLISEQVTRHELEVIKKQIANDEQVDELPAPEVHQR